jgi:hypothetical protein
LEVAATGLFKLENKSLKSGHVCNAIYFILPKTLSMLRYFLFMICVLSACNEARRSDEEFPVKSSSDWITYEGRIPVNEKDNLYLEVTMLAGSPGEGYYKLEEFLETPGGTEKTGSFKGNYITFAAPSGEIEVHFQNSSYPTGIKRRYTSPDGKRIREEDYRVRDLVLKKDGDYKLVALDNSNEPISLDENHNLSKRTSNLFTVEGKFAHVGDSSVFYELNTNQTWPVSRQGAYELATRQYHQLANEKNEGIYLKGTGFSIRQIDAKGRAKESLVFKKIITMTSSPIAD